MIKVSVWNADLSDSYLKQVTQLGADYIDFGSGSFFPGVKEKGYPNAKEVVKIRKRIKSFGLDINRVTLPDITHKFMKDDDGGMKELENTSDALKVFGDAGIPIVRQRFGGDTFDFLMTRFRAPHRGGYLSRAQSRFLNKPKQETPSQKELQHWWDRFCKVYDRLVPLAEEHDVKLAIHPSDTPNPDTPLGGLGFHRVIDAYPSRNVGYLYCCGTRAEAGGSALVLDEINHYGRKGRIFMAHLRNVRGSLATAGGYEEVLLDDGDMNMFRILLELRKVGFDGCVNADHIPPIEGDTPGSSLGLAYSIGYLRSMLAALAA